MYFYRVYGGPSVEGVVQYFGGQRLAHEHAKSLPERPLVRVERVDIKCEMAVLLALLNEDFEAAKIEVLSCYRLTPRGGLTPCEVGE
jgi:hypothetical protein